MNISEKELKTLLHALRECAECLYEEFEAGRESPASATHPIILRHRKMANKAMKLVTKWNLKDT